MIRTLRKCHLVTFAFLLVALPVVFLLTLSVRTSTELSEALPAFERDAHKLKIELDEREVTLGRSTAALRFLADSDSPEQLGLEITIHDPIEAPDVLLYWSDSDVSSDGMLPARAYLLGSLGTGERLNFLLPEAAFASSGFLCLYSLGHQQVVSSVPLQGEIAREKGRR